MKKFLIGLSLPLVMLFILTSGGCDKTPPPDAKRYEDYGERLLSIFKNLIPHSEAAWDEGAFSPDKRNFIIKNLRFTYSFPEAEPSPDSDGKRQLLYRGEIAEMVLEEPNIQVGLQEGVAPLAQRITRSGVSLRITPQDGRASILVTAKEEVDVVPEGPWQDILALSGQKEADRDAVIANLSRLQAQSTETSEITLRPKEDEKAAFTIGRVQASRIGPFHADKVLVSKTEFNDPDGPGNGVFAIDEMEFIYDLRQIITALYKDPNIFKNYQTLAEYKFNLSLLLRNIKMEDGNVSFTVKDFSLAYQNDSSLTSRLGMNEFRVENDWLSRDSSSRQLASILQGSPLLLSLAVQGEYIKDGFAANTLSLSAPKLANINIEALASGPPSDFISDNQELRFEEALAWLRENVLFKELSLRYEDEGLIDAVIAIVAEMQGVAPAQMREALTEQCRSFGALSSGFIKELAQAAAGLLSAPGGRLSLSLTPAQPMPARELMESLFNSTDAGETKYIISTD
ncbi:MAG: hypothetical protein LBJ14_04930 [Desulfarculales bacterium]|jgi:hypothetical protein|nr:hypothetical protein [Desulfarculales bacterium]